MDTSAEPTTVPIGLSFVAGGVKPVLRFVDRDHKNVVAWHEYASGGHDAAHQAPAVPVADVRGFHGDLLTDHADI